MNCQLDIWLSLHVQIINFLEIWNNSYGWRITCECGNEMNWNVLYPKLLIAYGNVLKMNTSNLKYIKQTCTTTLSSHVKEYQLIIYGVRIMYSCELGSIWNRKSRIWSQDLREMSLFGLLWLVEFKVFLLNKNFMNKMHEIPISIRSLTTSN